MTNATSEAVAHYVEPPLQGEHATQALAKFDGPRSEPLTPAQARVEAVAHLLQAAYSRASTLTLTPEETAALKADFPDDAFKPGASGNPNHIYIEHAYLRDRFDTVLGMGQWSVIPMRPHWAEDFQTSKGKKGVRLYAQCALLVRGCFICEQVGSMDYYPNDQTNYGDAWKGAVTAAFRRCAADFGVGLQAWKQDFCNGWWDRKRSSVKAGLKQPAATKEYGLDAPLDDTDALFEDAAPPTMPQQSKQDAPKANSALKRPIPTDAHRKRMISLLEPVRDAATEFMRKIGWLLPNAEQLEDLELCYVPATEEHMQGLGHEIELFTQGFPARAPYPPHEMPLKGATKAPTDDEPWRAVVIHFGKHAGATLDELDRKYLFGLWANFQVETTYNGQPLSGDVIAKAKVLREALNKAGIHYKFKKSE